MCMVLNCLLAPMLNLCFDRAVKTSEGAEPSACCFGWLTAVLSVFQFGFRLCAELPDDNEPW